MAEVYHGSYSTTYRPLCYVTHALNQGICSLPAAAAVHTTTHVGIFRSTPPAIRFHVFVMC